MIIIIRVSLRRLYTSTINFIVQLWNSCFGKIYGQWCCLEDSTDIQHLWYCRSISPKASEIILKNFLDFSLDTIERQSMISFSSLNSKNYVSVDLNYYEDTFLEWGKLYPFQFKIWNSSVQNWNSSVQNLE